MISTRKRSFELAPLFRNPLRRNAFRISMRSSLRNLGADGYAGFKTQERYPPCPTLEGWWRHLCKSSIRRARCRKNDY